MIEHNRITSRLLFEMLAVHDWSERQFAKRAGVSSSVLSEQLSGKREIHAHHLIRYLYPLHHEERPKLLAAWLRDHLPAEVVESLLDITGHSLSLDVRQWAPRLDEENNKMLSWWGEQITRDNELAELFILLSAKAGYRRRHKPSPPPGKPGKLRMPPREILDGSVIMMWTEDIDKRCNYVNAAWCRFTGSRLEQNLGRGWLEFIHPEDRAALLKNYRRAFEQREAMTNHYRLRRADGKYVWTASHGAPRYDGEGNFMGYIGTAVIGDHGPKAKGTGH
jgi:PAS domain S-box-containing protein